MPRKYWLMIALVGCVAMCLFISQKQFHKTYLKRPTSVGVDDKLMRLYAGIDAQGTYDVISSKGVAEQFVSRNFFKLEDGAWRPNDVPFGTDYGLAISLRSVASQMEGVMKKLRAAIPEEGAFLPPTGHHITVHHLCNNETITKLGLNIKEFNGKIVNGFLPGVAAVLDKVPSLDVTITFRRIIVGPSDGSIIMVGTAEPQDVFPVVRREMWNVLKGLELPSLRSAPWEIIHSTIGRLLPTSHGTPEMYIQQSHYSALRDFIDSYSALPPSQQLRITVNFKEALSFMHNKQLFSVATFHDVPVHHLQRHSEHLEELRGAFRAGGALLDE